MLFVQKSIFAIEVKPPIVEGSSQICSERLIPDCNEIQPVSNYSAHLNVLSPSVHSNWKQACIIRLTKCKRTPMPDRPSNPVKIAVLRLFFKRINLFLCIALFS
jgi:hypothetical protein